MSDRFTNKTVVVTGGGSGIGQGICGRFAADGAHIVVLELNEAGAAETVTQITGAGGAASVVACDVGDQAAVKCAFDQIWADRGRVDVLINNAGIAHIGTVETTTEDDMDRIYRVNVKGVYNCIHACIGRMVDAGGGVILNMASIASFLGIPERFAYSTSKGAVMTMTLSVARDYLDKNIRCNCICPARVHTPFVDNYIKENYPGKEKEMFEKLSASQPIGRMGKPEEIAALAAFLCSDEAGFITGSCYDIDGGTTLLR